MKACQVRLARHDLQPKRASIPAATPGYRLIRGLRCPKLHCPPRLKMSLGWQEMTLNDDVLIAVDPHKASNTAAVLDP